MQGPVRSVDVLDSKGYCGHGQALQVLSTSESRDAGTRRPSGAFWTNLTSGATTMPSGERRTAAKLILTLIHVYSYISDSRLPLGAYRTVELPPALYRVGTRVRTANKLRPGQFPADGERWDKRIYRGACEIVHLEVTTKYGRWLEISCRYLCILRNVPFGIQGHLAMR